MCLLLKTIFNLLENFDILWGLLCHRSSRQDGLLLSLNHIASHWLTLVSCLQFMCLGKPVVKRYGQIVNITRDNFRCLPWFQMICTIPINEKWPRKTETGMKMGLTKWNINPRQKLSHRLWTGVFFRFVAPGKFSLQRPSRIIHRLLAGISLNGLEMINNPHKEEQWEPSSLELSEGNDRVSCEEEPVKVSHPLATREEEDVLVHQSISCAFNPL